LAATVVAQLQASDPQRTVVFDADEDLVVDGDRELLKIVLGNLLGNAWKFTSKRAAARIELRRTELLGVAVFSVRDDGAGFDMKHVGTLFTPFRRLHPATEYEGTGVGLATVERIVRRHGGRVWAEAAPDAGAAVHFTLEPEPPLAPRASAG
jgi:signal transduction histidine kinase